MTDEPKPVVAVDPDLTVHNKPMFGRLPAKDERDRRFSMAAPKSERSFRNWLSPGPIYDQGQTSMCVAYAANRFLISHKVVNHPLPVLELYKECQQNDEWDGEDYDGTSVRAAFKVMKLHGFVGAYTWATEAEAVMRQVLEVGPVQMGTDWTMGMMVLDGAGYIWPVGELAGGHSWLIIGASRTRVNPDGSHGAFRLINSWGVGWGQKGKAWISLASLQKLMDGLDPAWPGEAATATELDIT